MIAYFILGVCLLAGVLLLSRWFIAAEPRRVVSALRWVAAGVGLVLGGFLLWGGRDALAVMVLPALVPLLLRWRAAWNRIKAAQGPSPGQTSSIRTRFLHMSLDHDSGEMEGLIIEGHYRGRNLSELSLEELVTLWGECRAADAQSVAILEAYLDRVHGADWRAAAGEGAGSSTDGRFTDGAAEGPMTRQEAYEILGLSEGAGPEDIRAAHRRLMQKLHPDHGGSNYLASKINEAKDLLLGT